MLKADSLRQLGSKRGEVSFVGGFNRVDFATYAVEGVRIAHRLRREVPLLHAIVIAPRVRRLVGVRHGWGRRDELGLGSLSALAAVETGAGRPRATDEREGLSVLGRRGGGDFVSPRLAEKLG